MILREIQVNEIPYNHSNDEETGEFISLPVLNSDKKLSPLHIIATNYYLEIIVYMIYFSDIREYPVIINLPDRIHMDQLPFLPLTQALANLFELQRAIVKKDASVSQIFVRGLLPGTVEAVRELERQNKIDPFLKKFFYIKHSLYRLKPVRAYAIDNRDEPMTNYKFSHIQKYLLWECTKNGGVYGLPIGPFTIDDLQQQEFQELIKPFTKAYVAGSVDPWSSTHLVVTTNAKRG